MKYIFFFLCLYLPLFSFAQSDKQIIDKVQKYIANKKYETAYELLDSIDPLNRIPDLVLLKEELSLNYFIASVNHEMYSFKDLKKDETLADFRDKPGESKMHQFEINKVLDSLVKVYPKDYRLYKGLGDFYYDVHIKYGDTWIIKNKQLVADIEDDYLETIKHNLADFQTFYRLGLVDIMDDKYAEGILCLRKATEMDSTDPDAQYNLAFAYLNSGDSRDSALKHAIISVNLYKDTSERGDAARMTGVIYGELGNTKKAVEYMELSDKIAPGSYSTMKILVDMYLKDGEKKKAKSATEKFYRLDPQNPTIYNDLVAIYTDNKQQKQLIDFFQRELKTAENLPVQYGSLYFYIGRLYLDTDKVRAKANLVKAKEILSKVYSPDNEVFQLIDQALKKIE